jgi:glc operon protein GlcG
MTKLASVVVAAVFVFNAAAWGGELRTRKVLTFAALKEIVTAAEEHARKNDWRVAITVLDEGGHLLYFSRMDKVQIASIEVSMRKAESALKYQRPGKVFAEQVPTRPQVMVLPGAFPFEGGVPIVHEGEVIGAIGVSGVLSEQDAAIAMAGIEALERYLKK